MSISKNPDDNNENYMKIEINWNVKLPLNKTIEIPNMKIVIRGVFPVNNKYYPQVFLDECLCKL